MSIVEIQELLAQEGERRRRLGLLVRCQVEEDWDLRSSSSQAPEAELRALEDD